MSTIQDKYYGFSEYPVEIKEPTLTKKPKACSLQRVIKKIQAIFEQIKKFLAGIFSFLKGAPARLAPTTATLDGEIKNLQKSQVAVGEWSSENDILVTRCTNQTADWRLNLINQANHSIEISGNYVGGEVFRTALNAIEERIKQRPKLQVYIIYSPELMESQDKVALRLLSEKYKDNFHSLKSVFQFNRKGYRIENHTKILVVDEKYCITGGTNFTENLSREVPEDEMNRTLTDRIFGPGSIDMDVVCKGSLASTLRREFFKLYSTLEYKEGRTKQLINHYTPIPEIVETTIEAFDQDEQLIKSVKAKTVTGCPNTPVNCCTREYHNLLSKTGQRPGGKVSFAQMFFHPTSEMQDQVLQNSKNIEYTVITTGIHQKSPKATLFFAAANMNFLSKLKVEAPQTNAYYFESRNLYHRKGATFEPEGEIPSAVIGSYNLGGKSRNDYELILVLEDKRVVDIFNEIFKEDITRSKEITSERAQEWLGSRARKWTGNVQNELFPVVGG